MQVLSYELIANCNMIIILFIRFVY